MSIALQPRESAPVSSVVGPPGTSAVTPTWAPALAIAATTGIEYCSGQTGSEESEMARILGVGVIGMGWMGTVHSRSYLQVADRFRDSDIQPRLIICADEVEARAREARERFGFERHTTSWQDVIADPDVLA